MKKLLFLIVFIYVNQLISAQVKDTIPDTKDSSLTRLQYEKNIKGGYITMQTGQVMIVKDGKATKLETDKILRDGTTVTTEGKVKKTDGTTLEMKERDRIYLEEGLSRNKKDQT
jgi:hypothetical protein